MIDIEKCIKQFVKYSKKFDLTDDNIMRKFHHTFRVMEYCKDIARSEKLSDSDVLLAEVCGLLHDIGRYEEWTTWHTYIDSLAYDHGDLGYEVLTNKNYINKYTKDRDEQKIILLAVKNHNKYHVDDELKDRYLLFANIVRDADKLDIIKEQCNSLDDMEAEANKDIIKELENGQMCNNVYIRVMHDHVLKQLGFIYDFNFKYSLEFILENNVISQKIDLLETHTRDIKALEKVKEILIEYVNKKLNKW